MPNNTPIFLSINDACSATGFSKYYLRTGCKNNTIPHINAGTKYLINVPAFLNQVVEESQNSIRRIDDDKYKSNN